eukprot:4621204-Prymnesium_polylepis.1
MPFCLLPSGKPLKECANAVGDLKQTKHPHHNAQKACSTQIGGGKPLKDYTNAVGDLEKTKHPHHNAQK